jgi:hypothetical protein
MTELDIIDTSDFVLPKYSDIGWLKISIKFIDNNSIEIEDSDYDGCVFWINEGIGIDYFIKEYTDIRTDGEYLIKGIIGKYIKSDGYSTDDDERWYYDYERWYYDEIVKL